jgi:predicted nucleic acid-binding protein
VTIRSLGCGEKEAIALAIEIQADRVILDDHQGRELAKRLGLQVVGTVGILLAAKRRRLIPAVKPQLDALLRADFFIATKWYREALLQAGEL